MTEKGAPSGLPSHRLITSAEAAICEADFQRGWNDWLNRHQGDDAVLLHCSFAVHRAIWQGAYKAATITVRD